MSTSAKLKLEVFSVMLDACYRNYDTSLPTPVARTGLDRVLNACRYGKRDHDQAYSVHAGLTALRQELAGRPPVAGFDSLDRHLETAVRLLLDSAPDQTSLKAAGLCVVIQGQGAILERLMGENP